MSNEGLLIRHPAQIRGRVEVVRSFSYKLNVGNYESRDFFCSQKCECDATEAEEIGNQLHELCRAQVLASVGAYMRDVANQRGRKTA